MCRLNRGVLLLAAVLGTAASARADIIHESAVVANKSQINGVLLADAKTSKGPQFVGSRFHVDVPVQVEAIGGLLGHDSAVANGTIFGVIVSLAGPAALPLGKPFDSTAVAAVVFPAPEERVDLLVPLSATLPPGDYALIFGSGEFGAAGASFLSTNATDIAGRDSYFVWNGSAWFDAPGLNDVRFVVTGTVLPEPTTLVLLGSGLGLLGLYHRRGRRR
jgi:hypothetical protein